MLASHKKSHQVRSRFGRVLLVESFTASPQRKRQPKTTIQLEGKSIRQLIRNPLQHIANLTKLAVDPEELGGLKVYSKGGIRPLELDSSLSSS